MANDKLNGRYCFGCGEELRGRRINMCGKRACKAKLQAHKYAERKAARLAGTPPAICINANCKNELTGKQSKFCSPLCKQVVTIQRYAENTRRVKMGLKKILQVEGYKSRWANKRRCSICKIIITDKPKPQNKAVTTAVVRDGVEYCIACANEDRLMVELLNTEKVLFTTPPKKQRGQWSVRR